MSCSRKDGKKGGAHKECDRRQTTWLIGVRMGMKPRKWLRKREVRRARRSVEAFKDYYRQCDELDAEYLREMQLRHEEQEWSESFDWQTDLEDCQRMWEAEYYDPEYDVDCEPYLLRRYDISGFRFEPYDGELQDSYSQEQMRASAYDRLLDQQAAEVERLREKHRAQRQFFTEPGSNGYRPRPYAY